MEVVSGSSSNLSSSSSSGSFNRLKFGKKNNLKDAGRSSAAAAESERHPRALTKKWKKDVVVQSGQPPLRCQVEGCEVDLRSGKAYYSRHRVCGIHSKSAKVVVAGAEQRFCQQCSRFHMISEFDKGKRSCRRRLACHNERRRKQQPDETLFGSYGTESSSKARGSFMLNFSAHSKLNSTASSGEIFSPYSHPHPWRPEISEILFQGGSTDTRSKSRECLTGVSDCSRALSLLSTQTWESRNGIKNNAIETPPPMVVQLLQPSAGTKYTEEESIHGGISKKSFKANESNTNNNSSSQKLSTEVGQIQNSQPIGTYYYGDLDEVGQQNEIGYVGLFEQQSVEYDSIDSSMPHHAKAYDSFLPNMLI